MEKVVSVIIPVYNVKKYLSKCIESVVNQTYNKLEIILVNDGSNDGSNEICEKYKDQDNRIVFISKENGGLSSARNVGLDISKGEYVTFLDSDDYIDRNMIRVLVNNLEKNQCDISIIDPVRVDESDNVICSIKNKLERVIYNKEEAIEKYCEGKFIPAWGKLYKKCLFDNIRFPIGVLNEDEAIMIKVFDNCKRKIIYDNSQLYYYLYRESGSITNNKNSIKNYEDWVKNSYSNMIYIKENYPQLIGKAEFRYYTSIISTVNRLLILEENQYKLEIQKYKDMIKRNRIEILKNRDIDIKFKLKCYTIIFNIKLYKFIRKFNIKK